ncbi:hypothetical protein [Endozoicomonas sp.]|uniref:hypothetical protein n=1 Tax=Endozoicomonas sp. TaxID=1892382 RepID=UPI00383ACC7D
MMKFNNLRAYSNTLSQWGESSLDVKNNVNRRFTAVNTKHLNPQRTVTFWPFNFLYINDTDKNSTTFREVGCSKEWEAYRYLPEFSVLQNAVNLERSIVDRVDVALELVDKVEEVLRRMIY